MSTALETINSKLEGLIDLVSNNLFHLKSMPPGSVVSECWGFNLSPTLTSQSKSSSSVIFTSSIPRSEVFLGYCQLQFSVYSSSF